MTSSKIAIGKIDHICSVVSDIEAAVRNVEKHFETPPVKIEDCTSTARLNGKVIGRYSLKMAMVKIAENITLELLQITEGKSVEQVWFKKHGESVHHVAIKVRDMDAEAEKWQKSGLRILQEDGGKWIYIDTESILGMNIELVPE